MTNASNPEATRQYYASEVPKYVEVVDHLFVDAELCDLIKMEIGFNSCVWSGHSVDGEFDHSSSSSATNVAFLFDKALSKEPAGLQPRASPSYAVILDCFFLYALLKDCQRSDTALELPHNGDHSDRLTVLMHTRNERIAGTGLDHWNHKCKECFKRVRDSRDGIECTYAQT